MFQKLLDGGGGREREREADTLRNFINIKTSDIIFSPNCAYEHTSNFCGRNSAHYCHAF